MTDVYVLCRKKLVGNMLITIGVYHKIFRNHGDAIAEMKSKSMRDYHIMRSSIAGDGNAKKVYIFAVKCIAGCLDPKFTDRLYLDSYFHSNINTARFHMQTNAVNNGIIYKHTPDFNRICTKSSTEVWTYRLRSFDVV